MLIQKINSKWTGLIAFTWLCAISCFYLRDWDPLKLHPLSLLVRELPLLSYDIYASLIHISKGWFDLLLLALGVLAALGVGDFLLSFFKMKIDRGQRITLSLALGMGTLSYYTFGLGMVRGYNEAGIIFSKAFLLLLALRGILLLRSILKKNQKSYYFQWSHFCFISIVSVVMLFLFFKAFRPAVFYDAITYHLGVPNYHILEGGITYIPYDSYSNFPFVAEMIYTLGMLVSGLKLAQCTSVLIYLLTSLLIYDFCRSFVQDVHPTLPALFYLSTPAFMEASILYTNDLHLAYFTLVTVYCLFLWEKHQEPGYIVLTGIFAGLCFSTKYIALTYVPFLSITGIIIGAWQESKSHIFKTIVLCSLPAIVVFIPWLIKNFLFTGNPLYPAFYSILAGNDMTLEQFGHLEGMVEKNKSFLTGILTNAWKIFLTNPQHDHYAVGENLSPIILIFTPCLLLVRNSSQTIKKLFLFSAICFFLWNVTFIVVRFFYPATVLLLIVSGYALCRTSKNFFAGSGVLLVIGSAFYLVLNFCMGFYQVNLRTATFGMDVMDETENKYLMRHMIDDKRAVLDSLPIYHYINDHTAPDAVVLIIGDAQHLYIKRRHRYTYLSGTTPYEIFKNQAGNHAEIAKYLKAQGITHIVFNPPEMIRLQQCGAINYKEEDNVHIKNFLQSPYAKYITAYKRASILVYLFTLK